MTVSRAVIMDLLPLYLANEASPDTRALVESALQEDPTLAALLRDAKREPLRQKTITLPSDDLELRTVHRTRRVLARQRWLFGLAMGFTALGLSVAATIGPGGITHLHLAILDNPLPLGGSLLIGCALWVAYALSRRASRG